jgi:hypothetical protein
MNRTYPDLKLYRDFWNQQCKIWIKFKANLKQATGFVLVGNVEDCKGTAFKRRTGSGSDMVQARDLTPPLKKIKCGLLYTDAVSFSI